MLRKTLAWLVLVVLALGMGAVAAEAQPTHFREREHKRTETFHDEIPCVGPGTITITENGHFKVTEFEDGRYHLNGTFAGKFVADPDDPAFSNFTGSFTSRFNESVNQQNFVGSFVFRVNGVDADGNRVQFHAHGHIVIDLETLAVKTEFLRERCG